MPDETAFAELAKDASVVPVAREVFSDRLTPVVAFSTVGDRSGAFLLESVVGGEKWARYSFVGFDPELIVRGVADRFERVQSGEVIRQDGVDPWAELRRLLSAYRPPEVDWLPRFWGGAVGYTSYDAVRTFEPTVGAPMGPDDPWAFEYAVGGTVLVFDNVRRTLRVVVPAFIRDGDIEGAYARATAKIDEALVALEAPSAPSPLSPLGSTSERPLPQSSFERGAFCDAVRKAQQYITAGDIFQVVLSQRFELDAGDVDPFDVYRAMRVINPSPYMYFLRFDDRVVAGASPETLVRLEDGQVHVRPIAGTRPRGKTDAEDKTVAKELLADDKERAEHVMLVDLGRNDVGRISKPGTVSITDNMVIEYYSHVMHIVSSVVGELGEGMDALDVLAATFPAGTLSGAPKVRAMQIIEELEPARRGIYGGAIGYIGFDGNMDVAIAIRTVVAAQGKMWLQAGAGIVEASDPEREYDETVNKARAGLVALEIAKGR